MNRFLHTLLFFVLIFPAYAQTPEGLPYTFSELRSADATDVKNQAMTGTCWSFATTSFMESELMRMGKGSHDVSEMYNVRMTYPEKARRFIRYMGKAQFGPGSLSHDVINVIRLHGMVPESVYSGLHNGKDMHDHGELDALLEGMLKALAARGQLTEQWDEAVGRVLDVYLGEPPAKFDYQGKSYTPASFRDAMGVNPDHYVSLSSFNHHPFYNSFILEVPDNFSQGSFYNLPLDEFMKVIDDALAAGFTIAWDADVSEQGFSFRNGMAILPVPGTAKEQLFQEVVPELVVTQENRQQAFDNLSTTDDHLMHIVGTAVDQRGTKYYLVKNSWGQGNELGGYQYVSESYMRMKTLGIVLHQDALSKELRKRMGR